jgi:hypothetical protein
MLYQNPAIQSRVEVHLVEEAKGEPSKLLLSFLCKFTLTTLLLMLTSWFPVMLGLETCSRSRDRKLRSRSHGYRSRSRSHGYGLV